jgi:hypothetical protein
MLFSMAVLLTHLGNGFGYFSLKLLFWDILKGFADLLEDFEACCPFLFDWWPDPVVPVG